MKGPKENVFDGCVYAGDFVRRLDFLGIYLSPKRQRDLTEALTEQFEDRFNTGVSVGFEDGYEEGRRWGAD